MISDIFIRLLPETRVQKSLIVNSEYEEYDLIKKIIRTYIENHDSFDLQDIVRAIFSIYQNNNDRELIEIVDYIGRYNIIENLISATRYESQIEIFKQLVNWFEGNCNLFGVLYVISFFYPNKQNVSLLSTINLDSLNVDNFNEAKYKEAAIIVSLARREWSNYEIDLVINYATNSTNEYSRIIPAILNMVENKQFSQSLSKQILNKLHNKISKSETYSLHRVVDYINEFLATKTSVLSNQSKWTQLGLPSGASSLLSE